MAALCGTALALSACGRADRAEHNAPAGSTSARDPVEALVMDAGAKLLGRPGPALTFRTLAGDTVDLSRSYGRKPVYLKLWATWCSDCLAQMPALERDYGRINDDFTVLAVASGINESEQDGRATVKRLNLHVPATIDDGRLANFVNLRATPVHVVIGRDGKVLYVGQKADAKLEAALAAAAAEAPASAVTPSGAPASSQALSQLPDRTLKDIDEKQLRLAPTGDDKPTVVVFFLPWCEGSPDSFPADLIDRCRKVREEAERRRTDGRARWIGIASGLWELGEKDVARYRDHRKVTLPIVFDASGSLFRDFGVRSTPVIMVFGPDGKLSRTIDESRPGTDLRSALDRALQ
jgi:thiol-disulfide isomerase/thioredoxin